MTALTPPQRRALRARAHHLQPVVSIGQHGLTPGVLREIDLNLKAHELIKIRVFNEDRVARESMLGRICAELDAAAVQHLGKLLIVWRPAPEEVKPEPNPVRSGEVVAPTRRSGRRGPRKGVGPMAKSTPQARRPRTPMARTPARPPRTARRVSAPAANPVAPGQRRRRTDKG